MTVPLVVSTIPALRRELAVLRASGRIAMVPTMGALHRGHAALVQEASRHAEHVVVSIFVNPAQFAPHEDFAAYPRALEADLATLGDSAALIFAPAAAEMYPTGHATTIAVGGPGIGLESDARPHFFGGVATVVAKLLIAAGPDIAVFGEKDYQQLLVVKQMVRDLALTTQIIAAPTVREADGLALSSRNAYLSAPERIIAGHLNQILREVAVAARQGDIAAAETQGRAALGLAGFDSTDYLAIRDGETLAPIEHLVRSARVLAAVRVGATRLIDNLPIG